MGRKDNGERVRERGRGAKRQRERATEKERETARECTCYGKRHRKAERQHELLRERLSWCERERERDRERDRERETERETERERGTVSVPVIRGWPERGNWRSFLKGKKETVFCILKAFIVLTGCPRAACTQVSYGVLHSAVIVL